MVIFLLLGCLSLAQGLPFDPIYDVQRPLDGRGSLIPVR